MLTYCSYAPNVGSAWTFGPTSDTFPLTDFDPEPEFDNPNEAKMQASGTYPTFGYIRALTVTFEGDIIGASFSDYGAKRDEFLRACTHPEGTITARRHGQLTIQMANWSERARADVRVVSRHAPIKALYPTVGKFFIVFVAFDPYFRGVTQPQNLYLPG